MARQSVLVTVTTAGTPVQVSATSVLCRSVLVQALPVGTTRGVAGNTGNCYVCNEASESGLATGVDAILVPGASYTQDVYDAHNGIDLASYWIDADTSANKVLVSYTQN